MSNSNDIEKRLAAMEREVSRLRAVVDIQNLMGRETNNHIPLNMHRKPQMFAIDRPDVSVEIADRGRYVGAEAIRILFEQQFQMILKGNLLIHYLATPMIEVAGDGLTAKGAWLSPGLEAVRHSEQEKPVPLWSFGAYAVDFVRQEHGWKIWHFRWFRTIKCRFDRGWVDDLSMAFTGPLPGGPAVKPPLYHNPYTPEFIQQPIPPCPEPYETWTAADEDWAYRARDSL